MQGRQLTKSMLQDIDHLIAEKWDKSEQTLWTLNQLIYVGSYDSIQDKCSRARQPD